MLVATIDAQWEGMGDVGSARYEIRGTAFYPVIMVKNICVDVHIIHLDLTSQVSVTWCSDRVDRAWHPTG